VLAAGGDRGVGSAADGRSPRRSLQDPRGGKILGHSSIATTQRYAHLQVDQQRGALEKLGALVQTPKRRKAAAKITPEITPAKNKGHPEVAFVSDSYGG
jgi:hypothetical protein